jgi:hypothetical protein
MVAVIEEIRATGSVMGNRRIFFSRLENILITGTVRPFPGEAGAVTKSG